VEGLDRVAAVLFLGGGRSRHDRGFRGFALIVI